MLLVGFWSDKIHLMNLYRRAVYRISNIPLLGCFIDIWIVIKRPEYLLIPKCPWVLKKCLFCLFMLWRKSFCFFYSSISLWSLVIAIDNMRIFHLPFLLGFQEISSQPYYPLLFMMKRVWSLASKYLSLSSRKWNQYYRSEQFNPSKSNNSCGEWPVNYSGYSNYADQSFWEWPVILNEYMDYFN